MSKKLSKFKSKFEEYLPEIFTVVVFVATAVFYSKSSLQNEAETNKNETFHIALDDAVIWDLKNGESVVWEFGEVTIDLVYDPDC